MDIYVDIKEFRNFFWIVLNILRTSVCYELNKARRNNNWQEVRWI